LKPICIDLFSGLGGWAEGALAEGYDVIGFDIERHVYGEHRYPAQLVLQDVLTLHGSQFKDAALIVASPPCQEFSYMAMPWSLAKAKAAAIRADETGQIRSDLTRLFDACFRIQREACEAAGRHIPMVVENVRGANEWVGRSRWNFGSFHLWGDVPALMPMRFNGFKSSGMNWSDQTKRGQDFTRVAGRQTMDGLKHDNSGWRENGTLLSCNRMVPDGIKRTSGGTWFGDYREMKEGIKQGGTWWHDPTSASRTSSSKSPARKAASAMIAKIPLPLATHIAKVWKPQTSMFD